DIAQYLQYEDCADLLLFDTKCAGMGGSGRHFDWSVLSRYRGTTPFLLSGGIGPGDAGRIAAFRHPMLAGIDLNSRFETAPAVKDAALLREFIEDLKKWLPVSSLNNA
ncbi:phosphoribosylanthranilate isomerase, partial [Parabacteroides distasonis]